MESLPRRSDIVKEAVASVSTCTAPISTLLKDLLQGPSDQQYSRTTSRPPPKSKTAPKRKPINPLKATEELSLKEKAQLASHVVNVALKTLGEATKPKAPEEPAKPASRTRLRRSNSTPMTPLAPRHLNRVSTSPATVAKANKNTSTPSPGLGAGCLPLVECIRLAFATLRTLGDTGKITLPPLQLESGTSSFISKLMQLGFTEHATKELQILKKRLDGMCGPRETTKKATKKSSLPEQHSKTISDLLDFPPIQSPGPVLNMVLATQLHVLRLIASLKRSAHIEAAIPIIRESHPSSPLNLLNLSTKAGGADKAKCAKHLEMMTQSLLALTPSLSSKDDHLALDAKTSLCPSSSLELQSLALQLRLRCWALVAHKGDPERDILIPFSRCLSSYLRRNQALGKQHYTLARDLAGRILSLVQSQGHSPDSSAQSALTAVHQILAISAQECGYFAEATTWLSKTKEALSNSDSTSEAKRCSTTAYLLAVSLRDPKNALTDDTLCQEVTEGVKGPLKGDSAELDELLQGVTNVRKAAITVLSADPDSTFRIPSSAVRQSLETLVMLCPRFLLRWLGKQPGSNSTTKEHLRYEQRRQSLLKPVPQTIDAALWLMKSQLVEERLECTGMDTVIHDCLALLEALDDILRNDAGNLHHIKISHLYFMHHNSLKRRSQDPSKDPAPLRALRKSVECVKNRPEAEKDKAQLYVKLERLIEMCKASGRREEALELAQFVKKNMLDAGVLASVADALAEEPPNAAWAMDEKTNLLSRSLCTIARIEHQWEDWTGELPDGEKAAVLEHWFAFIASSEMETSTPTLYDPPVDSLLKVYTAGGFPIRRLRVLLHLMSMNLDNALNLPRIRTLTEVTMHVVETSGVGEDGGLEGYLPHLEAFFISLTGIVDGYQDVSLLEKSLSTWTGLVEESKSKSDLEGRIDNPGQLIAHLQSMADFLRLKGDDEVVTHVLELSLSLSMILADSSGDELLDNHTSLIQQYINLGASLKAEGLLGQTKLALQGGANTSNRALANFHLSCAEYFLCVGSFDSAEAHLNQAREAATTDNPSKRFSRSRNKALVSRAFLLQSTLALERAESHNALEYGKISLRVLYQDWSKLEKTLPSTGDDTKPNNANAHPSTFKSSLIKDDNALTTAKATGPDFWSLALPMIKCLSRLSHVYAHLGMFQETIYHAEQALSIAKLTNSAFYTAQTGCLLSSIYARGCQMDRAVEFVGEVRAVFDGSHSNSFNSVGLASQIGEVYRELGDEENEAEMMEIAESGIKLVAARNRGRMGSADGGGSLEGQMAKLAIKEEQQPAKKTAIRARGHTRTASAAATTARGHARKESTVQKTKAATSADVVPAPVVEDIQVSLLRGSLLVQKALASVERQDWASALTVLREAGKLVKLPTGLAQERVAMAVCLIGESMELMMRDPVFSVIPESALCFPAIHDASSTSDHETTAPVAKKRAAKRGNGTATQQKQRSALMERLWKAQGYLMEIHETVMVTGDRAMVKTVTRTLQNLAIMLAAACSPRASSSAVTSSLGATVVGGGGGSTPFATAPIDLGRNLLWMRDQRVLGLEKRGVGCAEEAMAWPVPLPALPAPSTSSTLSTDPEVGEDVMAGLVSAASDLDLNDLPQLRRDYADILPPQWNVVSLAIDAATNQLTLVNFVAGVEPMVIKAPIIRDGEDEFTFLEGRAELVDIVARINRSCHTASTTGAAHGGKSKWWALRSSLEDELEDLLRRVEQYWLGGFRGVFSQHKKMEVELEGFRGALQGVLDKHLPSRQVRKRPVKKGRGGAKTAASASANAKGLSLSVFDDRVLELFVGLGDVDGDEELDISDELGDLLNFVTDILGWYGEENARDEIDWDSMVLETLDALKVYHSGVAEAVAEEEATAAKEGGGGSGREEGRHTILVLDPALHVFPWESMGCMREMAVCRVPSMQYLRDVLLSRASSSSSPSSSSTSASSSSQSTSPTTTASSTTTSLSLNSPPGLHLQPTSGTYILDPAADLTNTRRTFEQPLSKSLASKGWTPIVGHAPSEQAFSDALAHDDTLLYFGHGSGSQFIRARTVRRIEGGVRAAALLMGCSSAAIAWNGGGGFEVSGAVWNLLASGCPAVVGALWDVTDRDIDKFAAGMCRGWGLFGEEGGGAGAGAGKLKEAGVEYMDMMDDEDGEIEWGNGRLGKGKPKKEKSEVKIAAKKGGKGKEKAGKGEKKSGVKGCSLVEAVVKARGLCKFRGINGGAVVVYGVPAYIGAE